LEADINLIPIFYFDWKKVQILCITVGLVIIISSTINYISLYYFNCLFKLFNDLFKNNANRAENTERKQNQNYFMEMMTVEGVYDYLMYVGKM
jgi:hypothetical protein